MSYIRLCHHYTIDKYFITLITLISNPCCVVVWLSPSLYIYIYIYNISVISVMSNQQHHIRVVQKKKCNEKCNECNEKVYKESN